MSTLANPGSRHSYLSLYAKLSQIYKRASCVIVSVKSNFETKPRKSGFLFICTFKNGPNTANLASNDAYGDSASNHVQIFGLFEKELNNVSYFVQFLFS